jgi:hypothetical protein
MLARMLADSGKIANVGADQFIYFREGDPSCRIAPDIYVLPGVRAGKRIRSWKVWQEGFAPSFCFEVVSEDVRYDYEDKPVLYAEMGTSELVVFDPDSEGHAGRYRWQVFRRLKGRGLVRVEVSQADRVRAKELGVWLRQVGEGDDARVVPAFGKAGDELMPTPEEREARERAEKEQARAEKERERAGRERAELEIKRLQAALAKAESAAKKRRPKPRRPS